MKKKKQIKIRYVYIESKTEAEKKEQQERIDDAFDILFEEVLKEKI